MTAALQLLSHLEGDALNVALLVPAPRRVLRGGGGVSECACIFVMLNMPTDVRGDDRFSPGVTGCVTLNRLSCIVPPRKEPWERLKFDWDSSVDCMTDWVGALDHPVRKPRLDGVLMSHPSGIVI